MAARNQEHMEMASTVALEAMFTVMGRPNSKLRQCPVAIDTWLELTVAPHQTILGLALHTRRLSVTIIPEYKARLLNILTTTWHKGRDAFLSGSGTDSC